jgi:predicted kinase
MKNLVMMVGPSGSGKSTYALELQKQGYVYVNQDLSGKDHLRIFEEAIKEGKPVVVDRLNFVVSQRKRYLEPAKNKGYITKIVVLHQSYKTCLDRCINRVGHATIIDETNARSALNMFFTKYERVQDNEADYVERVWPAGAKRPAIICDLDGTLCDVTHRRHFVRREGKKDWNGFFMGMVDDVPNRWCADILRSMSKDYRIVYCSGRPNNWWKETVCWLKKHDLFCFGDDVTGTNFELFMRDRSDSRQDSIVKEIILDFEILTKYDPKFTIDDRKQVVDMWRSRGYTCLQCDEGDF